MAMLNNQRVNVGSVSKQWYKVIWEEQCGHPAKHIAGAIACFLIYGLFICFARIDGG